MAAKPVILKVRDVALAAKAAYDEGRLSAQGPTPMCSYRDVSGRPCAIGAALSTPVARRLDEGVGEFGESSIDALAKIGAVRTDNVATLRKLQKAHDDWATGGGRASDFARVLNNILAKTEEPS